MKTKLKIDFHSWSSDTFIPSLAETVAKHNAGISNIDLLAIEGYFKVQCARYGYTKALTHLDKEAGDLHLSLKGSEPFITVHEIQMVGELSASEQDLVTQENLS